MSTTLTVAGTDIIDDVLIADSTWQSAVNGAVGSCAFVVKDDGHTHSFTTGQEIILTVSGTKVWGGYVVRASRTFPLPVVDTSSVTTADRYWSIEGVDYNILFDKRVVRDTSDLNKVFSYAAGTYDDTVINDIYDNYLDVSGDGLTTSITRVGIAIFDIAGVTKGGTSSGLGNVAAQGYTWRQVMFSIVRNTGGIYFISPDKVFTYCDVETPSSPYVLTDTPATTTSGVGYRELEVLDDGSDLRNDVIVWGAGLGSQQIVSSRVQDATSIATHGTWQLGDFNGGIYKQATADTMASIYVNGSPTSKRGGKNDKVVFTATVRQPLFQVGQKVQVVNNVYGYSDTLPIRTMETKFVRKDEALFTLQCSFEVDAPWSMFDFFPFNNDGIGGFHFPIWPQPPGIIGMTSTSGCINCAYDEFDNRTVYPGWGDAQSGGTWIDADTNPGGLPTVSGGIALLCDWPTESSSQVRTASENLNSLACGSGPPDLMVTWYATEPFRSGTSFVASESNPGLYVLSAAGSTRQSIQFSFDDGAGYRANVTFASDGTGDYWALGVPSSTSLYYPPVSYTFSSVQGYSLRIQAGSFGARARMWPVYDDEPASWAVVSPTAMANPIANIHCQVLGTRASGTLPLQVYVELVDCCLVGSTSLGSGYLCEVAIDTGDHLTYQLSNAFQLGTTEVWDNGVLQTNGAVGSLVNDYAEEDPASGQITFFTARTTDDVIKVCYQAAGAHT